MGDIGNFRFCSEHFWNWSWMLLGNSHIPQHIHILLLLDKVIILIASHELNCSKEWDTASLGQIQNDFVVHLAKPVPYYNEKVATSMSFKYYVHTDWKLRLTCVSGSPTLIHTKLTHWNFLTYQQICQIPANAWSLSVITHMTAWCVTCLDFLASNTRAYFASIRQNSQKGKNHKL